MRSEGYAPAAYGGAVPPSSAYVITVGGGLFVAYRIRSGVLGRVLSSCPGRGVTVPGITESLRTALPSLNSPPGERLEIVTGWDADSPYQSRRPQILVPPTFRQASTPRVFVVVNQKGGADKTTSTVELAAAWAAAGLRVRVIDADHQEGATPARAEAAVRGPGPRAGRRRRGPWLRSRPGREVWRRRTARCAAGRC